MVYSSTESLVATSHLDNIMIIHTDDVVMVLNKDHPQSVKAIIEKIQEQGLDRYL
jgi:hypothetical protein